jgi:preprotein translocase subunit YajC
VPFSVIVIVGLLVVLWMLLVRPQRRRQLEQREMLARLAIGDEVVTAGGLYGVVEALDEGEIKLEIAPGTTVRVAKRAVAAVVSTKDEEAPVEETREEEEEPASQQEETASRLL